MNSPPEPWSHEALKSGWANKQLNRQLRKLQY